MVTELVEIVIKERGAAAASSSIKQVGRSSSQASSAVSALQAAVLALGAAFSARAIVDAADEFQRIERAIGNATKATGDSAAVSEELLRISNDTTTSLSDNAKLFQRLSVATKDLGASNRDVLDLITGLNSALVLSGASTSEASAGLIQLSQGLASGRFQGDELRSVLENLPQLAQALAKELGVTVGQLRALGAEGKLSTDTVFPALQRAVRGFTDQLAETPRTIGETTNVLKNNFLVAVGEINQALGGSTGVNGAIIGLAKNIRGILFTSLDAFIALSIEVLRAVDAVRGGLDTLGVEVVPNLGQSFKAAGLSILLFVQGLTNGINTLLVGIQAVNTGGTNLAAAINPFFNAETVAEENQKLVDAQNALVESSKSVSNTFDALGKVYEDVAKNGISTQSAAIAELTARLEKLRQGLKDAANATVGTGGSVSTQQGPAAVIGPSPEELKARAKEERDFQKIIADLRAQAEKDAQEQKTALEGLASIQNDINRSIAAEAGPRALAIHDLEVEIARAKELAAIAGQDPAGNAVVQQLEAELARVKLTTEGGQALAASVTGALGTGIQDAIQNGAPLADALGSAFENSANASLTAGFDKSLETLQKGLGSAFDTAANAIKEKLPTAFQGVASGFGAALTATVGFLAQQGLAALFGGGGNSQSSSSRGVRSAVTSTEAVRGIVAGPSQIAIAQVGDSIAEGFQPIAILLTEIVGLHRREVDILERAGSGRPGTGSDALTLATQSAPLASS